MLRKILTVILGLILCNVVFSGLAYGTLIVWPDYAIHGHRWIDQRIFTFPPIMASLNLLFWALSFAAAGWITARIARDSKAVWVLAGVMQLDAAYVHLFELWSTLPWWYNVIVVALVVPATMMGGRAVSASKDIADRRCRLLNRRIVCAVTR
jgi:hypothetical protein